MFAPPDHLLHPLHDIRAAGQHPPGVVQVTLQVRAGHQTLEVSLKTPTSQTVSTRWMDITLVRDAALSPEVLL